MTPKVYINKEMTKLLDVTRKCKHVTEHTFVLHYKFRDMDSLDGAVGYSVYEMSTHRGFAIFSDKDVAIKFADFLERRVNWDNPDYTWIAQKAKHSCHKLVAQRLEVMK